MANKTTDYSADLDLKQRYMQVKSATVIAAGDIVVEDPAYPGYIIPAASFPFQSLSLSAIPIALAFKGIALGNSAAGETDDVLVATEGVITLNCADATNMLVGDLVGVDDNSGATAFENYKVIEVTDPLAAIGRVVKKGASSGTTIQVAFKQQDVREFIMKVDVTANGTYKVFETDLPFAARVIDAWFVCTDANAGTIDITDGSSNIVTQINHGTTDKAILRAALIDDAKHNLAQGGKLYVVAGTGGTSIVYIKLMRV